MDKASTLFGRKWLVKPKHATGVLYTVVKSEYSVLIIAISVITVGMGSANEMRRYYVTPSLIGGTPKQNDPWILIDKQFAEKFAPRQRLHFSGTMKFRIQISS